VTTTTIVKKNQLVDESTANAVNKIGVEQLKIRSVLTCESGRGVCAKCYGRNLPLARWSSSVKRRHHCRAVDRRAWNAATMRTFHIGGTRRAPSSSPSSRQERRRGSLQRPPHRAGARWQWIALNKNGSITVHGKDGRETGALQCVIGSVISSPDGSQVKKGDVFVQWDPYNVPILTEKTGKVEFRDMISGVTVKREVDEATGVMGTVVIEHKEDLHPQIVIVDDKKEVLASYSIPAGAHVTVSEGKKIQAGALLAKTPRKIAKTKDITGGLPRVAELFEARRPKDAAEIAKIDGVVEIGGAVRAKRKIIVRDAESGAEEEHLVPLNKHIIVFKGTS
jgi:DNA-directed RNA polymerase subunit beta'